MKIQLADITTVLWKWETDDGLAAVEKDIAESIEAGTDEEWYSPLKTLRLVDDHWIENIRYSDTFDDLGYIEIQGEHQRELSRYDEEDWIEHLRRKKDGIV